MLEELQRRHPERFADAVLRTLQRRVSQWHAEHGDERELFFAQEHPPGRLGLSDFTVADELDLSLGGLFFPHRLYQFALAHSGWRHARVLLGGESFQSLAAGLQDALWMAGGVPLEHRTDSLSAAFNNLAEREELTKRYQALCQHYGMRPTRNNIGVSNENGAIEARQGSLKRGLGQALLLRAAAASSMTCRPTNSSWPRPCADSTHAAGGPGKPSAPASKCCRCGAPPTSRKSMRASASSASSVPRACSTASPRAWPASA